MDVLFFILDTACNRECPYCFYETGHLERTGVGMAREDWLRLTDEAGEAGVQNIILTGGEPLLGGEERIAMIEEILRRVNYHGMSALLITNGDFLTREIAQRLAAANLKSVSISQDSLTGVKGYKIKGWKAAEAALAAGLRVTLIMTITRQNFVDIPAIYRFAATRNLGLILQPAFVPENHPKHKMLSLQHMNTGTQQEILDAIVQWADGFGIRDYPEYMKTLLGRPGGKRPARCDMGATAAVVDCDGSFMPCFHRRDLRVGSALEESCSTLIARSVAISKDLRQAECWGMHCLSMFAGS